MRADTKTTNAAPNKGGINAMKGRHVIALAVAALALSLLGAPAASAAPVPVKLRIEGATRTIYEGTVKTEGHEVSTQTGGTHKCDGTNLGTNPTPGPTPTAALDTAAAKSGFTWDGTWFGSFEDFGVERIADTAQTETEFWAVVVNYQFASVGGCQQELKPKDEVVWAFNGFEAAHLLKLKKAKHGAVLVTDGATGEPIAGATVGPVNNGPGVTTDAQGEATPVFTSPGKHLLKAERADSIRSNGLAVKT
jgi:hypothetical protein